MLSLIQFGAEDAAAGEGAGAAEGSLGDAVSGAVKGAGGGQQGGGNGQKFNPEAQPNTQATSGGGRAIDPGPPARPPVSGDGETALKAASNPGEPGAIRFSPPKPA
jgi:hypothetical protein